jgi:hypothetical protein
MKHYFWKVIDFTGGILLDFLDSLDLKESYFDEEEITVYQGESEKVRQFFLAAFRNRLKWYLMSILVVILLSWTLVCWSNGTSFLQLTGLLLDLTGAVFLGIGLLRSASGIERDSTLIATDTFEGEINTGNEDSNHNKRDLLSVSSEARDTVDATIGITLLLAGFILQIVAIL